MSVKDMNRRQVYELECQMHAKYRRQDALIRLNDFVIYVYKDDLLPLSSFCSSANNAYGVKLSADYDIADEMDITKIDPADVDMILLDMLKNNEFSDTRAVEAAAKKVFAEKYGVSEKNIVAFSNII
jgi:hypothetical protein